MQAMMQTVKRRVIPTIVLALPMLVVLATAAWGFGRDQ